MSECKLEPYQLSGDLNNFFEIVSESKSIDFKLGDVSSNITMDIPSNLEFNNENINSELTSLSEYINKDIEEYLSCLASKSESEVINSLKTTVPQITEVFNIIIDPIKNDSLINSDSSNVFFEDPFTGIGYPYRLSNTPDSTEYVVSVKNMLQNIILENESNNGFKIVSDEKNNPFDSILFLSNDSSKSSIIEIIYIYNEE